MVGKSEWVLKILKRKRQRAQERAYALAVTKVAACFDNPLGGVR